ncbi:MAG: DUF4124 domain-containing protein [Myxococcota bacterium]
MRDRRPESSGCGRLSTAGLLRAGLLALLLFPFESHATVYKWVDENGISHYTPDPDQVPRGFRGQWRSVGETDEDLVPDQDPDDLEAIPPARLRAPGELPLPAVVEPAGASLPDLEPTDLEPTAPRSIEAPATPAATPLPSIDAPWAEPRVAVAPPRVSADPPSDLDARIASDRALLRELLSQPRENRKDWLQDPRLREIAERLPKLQAEKEAARSEATP